MLSFFAVLFIAGVIALIVWAIRGSGSGTRAEHGEHRQRDAALDEARRRYAAGEISREEYEVLERDLRR